MGEGHLRTDSSADRSNPADERGHAARSVVRSLDTLPRTSLVLVAAVGQSVHPIRQRGVKQASGVSLTAQHNRRWGVGSREPHHADGCAVGACPVPDRPEIAHLAIVSVDKTVAAVVWMDARAGAALGIAIDRIVSRVA